MRSKKSSNSAPAPWVPVGISSAERLVFSKPISRSAGHRLAVGLGRGRQRVGVAAHRVRLQEERIDLRQPGPLVGREHGVGLAGLGHDLVAVEDGRVLVGVKGHARVGQRAEHLGVALQRIGLVVAVGEHGLHVELARQRRYLLHRRRMPHDEPAAQRAQLGLELHQRFADELHAPVGTGQQVEDRLVEDENADHLAAGPKGAVEGCVVVHAKVAAEPHEPFGIGLVDGQ
jgi:hypothetical protein